VVGELDPLVDENRLLAEKLEAVGVRTSLHILPNTVHGVVRFNELAPVVRSMLDHESGLLRAALA
jgi:acetyl esterase